MWRASTKRVNIRDALYVVRTEATKTYYRGKQGEQIRYVDVISLYPYICKYGKFPVGHPEVYVGAACPLDCLDREGIMKCSVLPSRKLYNPVLPYKSNSKLMFPLCSVCADTMNQDYCTHSEKKRVYSRNMGCGLGPQGCEDGLYCKRSV